MTARSLATSAQARDLDATMQLQALDQPPAGDTPAGLRTPHGHYTRARYRAGARLARAHPREFTRYLQEELSADDEDREGAA